tara:strand:- start:48 stop:782 length:735 start_codon:yes stop_codon:yes gene_type:complete
MSSELATNIIPDGNGSLGAGQVTVTVVQELFMWDAVCLFLLYMLDLCLRRVNAISAGGSRARWFCMHSLGNAIVAAGTTRDLAICVLDHSQSREPATSLMPAGAAFSLHLYHCLAFKLRPEDWSHHLLFVFGVTPLVILHPTKAMCVCLFFCTGFPGMLDYWLLMLVKTQRLEKWVQKRAAGFINAYLRMPGGTLGASLLIQDGVGVAGRGMGAAVLGGLMLANSCYYGHQAISSAAVHEYKRT